MRMQVDMRADKHTYTRTHPGCYNRNAGFSG